MSNLPIPPWQDRSGPPAFASTASYYSGGSQPAFIRVIAVISIVMASLALFSNVIFFLIAIEASRFATFRRSATAGPAAPSTLPVPAASDFVPSDGIPAAQRQIIIAGLDQRRALSDPRKEQLDALLADAGKKIFHFSAGSLTVRRVAATVSNAVSIPSDSGKPDVEYVLGTGRLVVSDETAVFYPREGLTAIRTDASSITDPSGTHLATVQIEAVVARAQELSGNRMNQAQVAALRDRLQGPDQTLVTPAKSLAGAASQVASVQRFADETVAITTGGGAISIGPAGEIVTGVMPAAGLGPGGFQPPTMRRSAISIMFASTLLDTIAAGLLLLAGILLILDSRSARPLLLVYSVAKILLIVLMIFGVYGVMSARASDPSGPAMFVGIVAVLSLVYPLVLLIVMNVPAVRAYCKIANVRQRS